MESADPKMISKPVKQFIVITDRLKFGWVPAEHLEHYGLVNIKQSLYTSGLFYEAEEFYIRISREYSREFVRDILCGPMQIDAIMSVEVVCEDGERFSCLVPWIGREDINTYQKAMFNKQGNFILVVSKNPNRLDDIFPDEEPNYKYTSTPFVRVEEYEEEFDEFDEYEES